MISVKDLTAWLATLRPETAIVIDEGGLSLVQLLEDCEPSGNYLEIGGMLNDEPDDHEAKADSKAIDPFDGIGREYA